MARHILLISLCMALAQMLCSQDLENSGTAVVLNISPLSAFDPQPRYRFGVQGTFDRYSVLLDIGIGSDALNGWRLSDHWDQEYKAVEIRPEFRMGVFSLYNQLLYVGFEGHFLRVDAIVYDDYYIPESGAEIWFDSAKFRRDITGVNFKMGLQFFLKSGIAIDVYYGFGMRYREISHAVIEQTVIGIGLLDDDSIFNSHYHKEKSGWNFSVPIGFRIGYVLYQKED